MEGDLDGRGGDAAGKLADVGGVSTKAVLASLRALWAGFNWTLSLKRIGRRRLIGELKVKLRRNLTRMQFNHAGGLLIFDPSSFIAQGLIEMHEEEILQEAIDGLVEDGFLVPTLRGYSIRNWFPPSDLF